MYISTSSQRPKEHQVGGHNNPHKTQRNTHGWRKAPPVPTHNNVGLSLKKAPNRSMML